MLHALRLSTTPRQNTKLDAIFSQTGTPDTTKRRRLALLWRIAWPLKEILSRGIKKICRDPCQKTDISA